MFAINHAATALLVRRWFPRVPLLLALLSVQFVEFLWVLFNFLKIERTETEPVVRYVGDIHLVHMPWSHSLGTTILFAVLGALAAAAVAGRNKVAAGLAFGIASHILLDLATHNGDIAVAPGMALPRLGTYLYANWPAAAFILELAYGVMCWKIFRGSRSLLAVIVFFNLANISIFFAAIPGPESFFANRPTFLVTVILAQIIVTLIAVGITARVREAGYHSDDGRQPSSA